MARKSLSKKLRFEVFKRDGFVCQYCGAHPPAVILHVDHIHPVAEGGSNDIDNLITACEPCNLGKGAGLLSDAPQSLKGKAEELAEKEAQLQGYNEILMARATRIENEAWLVAEELECVEYVESYSRANLASIKRFLERLPFEEVRSAAEHSAGRFGASSTRAFRYFCGICWGKIREVS
ncbi:MAG: HNH endonuclease [Afipia sp.]